MAGHLRHQLLWVVTWLAAMLLGTAAYAQLAQPGKNAIAASLIPESAVVVPGETVTLALMMRPSPAGTAIGRIPATAASRVRSPEICRRVSPPDRSNIRCPGG